MYTVKSKVLQFRYESDAWKRSLEFMIQENTNLKNRLAEVVKSLPNEDDILNAAEQYQNYFIREDEAIRFLRGDIAEFDKLLVKEIYADGQIIGNVMREHKKLSVEIKDVFTEFNKMKFEFNNYLGEIL